jgi:hypothetical protein
MPFSRQPWPATASKNSPVAGLKTWAITGRPASTRATEMVNSGRPSTKARVPSIGSTTQIRGRARSERWATLSSDSQP